MVEKLLQKGIPEDAHVATVWVDQIVNKRSMLTNKDRVDDVRDEMWQLEKEGEIIVHRVTDEHKPVTVKTLYGWDKRWPQPFVCPVATKGEPAPTVRHGTLAEAGMKLCRSSINFSAASLSGCTTSTGRSRCSRRKLTITAESEPYRPRTAMSCGLARRAESSSI